MKRKPQREVDGEDDILAFARPMIEEEQDDYDWWVYGDDRGDDWWEA